MKRAIMRISAAFLLLSVFISCQPKEESQVTSDTQLESGQQLGKLVLEDSATGIEGFITFCSGEITLSNDSGEKKAIIGDIISQSDTITTGPEAYCEIQFGEAAVIYVEASTVLSVATLFAGDENNQIDLDLQQGTVLCKVERLLRQDDRFQVKTDTAVCGVRGTQFSVSQSSTRETTLAVREGAVAVVAPEVDALQIKAGSDSRTNEAVKGLQETAILVSGNEQIKVQESGFGVSEEDLLEINLILDEALASPEDEKVQLLTNAVNSARENIQTRTQELAAARTILDETAAEQLAKADTMELHNVLPDNDTEAETVLYKLTVNAVPGTAVITANGRQMGVGEFSKLYEEGKNLNIRVENEGYEPHEFTINMNEESSRSYTVRLNALTGQTIEDPQEIPTDDDPETILTEDTTVEQPAADTENGTPETIALNITANPADTELTVNGEKHSGSFSTEAMEGDVFEIMAARDGFKTETLTLTAGPALSQYNIELEPAPIEARYSIGNRQPINSLQTAGGKVFLADSDGTIKAFSPASGLLWETATNNKPNENSYPVVAGNRVYLSGVKELIILDAGNGSRLNSVALSGDMVHLFGRKVLPFGNQIVYPSNSELLFMDPSSGAVSRTVAVSGGSRMSPGVWNGKFVIANQKGELLVIDPDTGQTEQQLPTQALQPVANRVAVQGNRGVFCGRKGMVVASDLNSGTILWQKNLNGTIYTEITVGPQGCYPFVNNTITGLSWDGGSNLFNPIAGASCAPLYAGGKLYYGNNSNELIIANAASGRTEKRLNVGSAITATPVIAGNRIIVTAGNEMLVINPEGIVP